jgi:nicotinate-nucleotide adenylyltransferase
MPDPASSAVLFGGSFDPPHAGHVELIRKLLERPEINQVVVVPAWRNPFKESSHATPRQRLKWCRTVFDMPGVVVEDYEIKQKRAVYTVETWRNLKKKYPVAGIVVGSDNLSSLKKWKSFDILNENLHWYIAARAGHAPVLEGLKEWSILDIDIPVSSTGIRSGRGTEYLDPRIAEEAKEVYGFERPDSATEKRKES